MVSHSTGIASAKQSPIPAPTVIGYLEQPLTDNNPRNSSPEFHRRHSSTNITTATIASTTPPCSTTTMTAPTTPLRSSPRKKSLELHLWFVLGCLALVVSFAFVQVEAGHHRVRRQHPLDQLQQDQLETQEQKSQHHRKVDKLVKDVNHPKDVGRFRYHGDRADDHLLTNDIDDDNRNDIVGDSAPSSDDHRDSRRHHRDHSRRQPRIRNSNHDDTRLSSYDEYIRIQGAEHNLSSRARPHRRARQQENKAGHRRRRLGTDAVRRVRHIRKKDNSLVEISERLQDVYGDQWKTWQREGRRDRRQQVEETVGCEGILGSSAREDRYRVCEGDGSTCTTIDGLIDRQGFTEGYHDLLLIPLGATNIVVKEVEVSDNYLAVRNLAGHYFFNGDWRIDSTNPPRQIAGTTVHYEAQGNFIPEVIRALGPVLKPLYIVLLYHERNPGIRYQYSLPNELARDLDETYTYKWRRGAWGECSFTCGGGSQKRTVTCATAADFVEVDTALCDPCLKPLENRTCNADPCQSSWQIGSWSDCTSSVCGAEGIRYRHVFCGQRVGQERVAVVNELYCEQAGDKPTAEEVCNKEGECPSWHEGEWKPKTTRAQSEEESSSGEESGSGSGSGPVTNGAPESQKTTEEESGSSEVSESGSSEESRSGSIEESGSGEEDVDGTDEDKDSEGATTTPAPTDGKKGCGCTHSGFGCCSDGRTPAQGSAEEGCGCEASRYGCCPDGSTSAEGELFQGCLGESPIVPGEVCGYEKDHGSCSNFTARWYFDLQYGGCTRFWYGGCDGNLNKFNTFDECNAACVEPEGIDVCHLPRVVGPCTGAEQAFYHDSMSKTCKPFHYGGCLGNKNRFPNMQDCENTCILDTCLLDVQPGPCRGNFSRWYFDQSRDECLPFTFGGCKGNNNNFLSDNECMQRCIRGRSKDICTLPKKSGSCDETKPRWHFDATENRCMPFYYTGCEGNANRFENRTECETTCPPVSLDPEEKKCALPKVAGDCFDYQNRWYYDLFARECRSFVYSGCGGNNNNFLTYEACISECDYDDTTVPATPGPEVCLLPEDTGNCKDYHPRFYYDYSTGVCRQFLYTGCGGNDNRFRTSAECDYTCGESQDICQLPVEVGPCSGSFRMFYFDPAQSTCNEFDYGGCLGNKNRFDSQRLCQQRCGGTAVATPSPPINLPGQDVPLLPICLLPVDGGSCRSAIPHWYFDAQQGRCVGFSYGGCEGNANRFLSVEMCERQCGRFRNTDVCNQPPNAGRCVEFLRKWHHDPRDRTCRQFTYTGCDGNGNRFSSEQECSTVCIYHDQPMPQGNRTEIANIAICQLPADPGPCRDGSYNRWYYDTVAGTCKLFRYGGCSGNMNKFKTFNVCTQFCAAVRPPQITTTPWPNDPCEVRNAECRDLQCPYGLMANVDDQECRVCSCNEPCKDFRCPDGSQCAVEVLDQYNSTAGVVPVCREANKPGECPSLSQERYRCDNECDNDTSCSDNLKCCYNGCGYSCLPPPREEGYTPPYTEPPQAVYTEPPRDREPAVISESDRLVTSEEQDVATLLCVARGTPEPTVTWYKDGQPLDTTQGRFRIVDKGSLQVVGTLFEDAGRYTCVARNGLGQPDQREVELQITEGKPREAKVVPTRNPRPVVSMGQPTTIRCWAVGIPRPAITWWRGTKMLPLSSQKYEQNRDMSLRITIITLRDLGPYTCQAYNGQGRATSNTVTLLAMGPVKVNTERDREYLKYIVDPRASAGVPTTTTRSTTTRAPYVPPRTAAPRSSLYVTEVRLRALIQTETATVSMGKNLTFSCQVVGEPRPSVLWEKDGINLTPGDRVIITPGGVLDYLTVVEATKEDSGRYTCTARNEHGVASSSKDITVEGVLVDPKCIDNPFFANCELIVRAQYCNNAYYARFCCRSCTLAGQLPLHGPHLQRA